MIKFTTMLKKPLYVAFVMLLLTGCLGPKTPQEVSKAFWYAVIENDASAVVKYSTLTTSQDFDGFGLDWHGYTPNWGRVIIDGDEASIVTKFSNPNAGSAEKRKCVTYLVRRNEVWKVDYKLTGSDLHGGALGALFGQLNQLGNELSKNIDTSIHELNLEMERLSRKLQDTTDTFSQQASKIIEKYAEDLQHIMRQLADSINRALQDKNNHPSDRDRRTMTEVAADLDASSRNLSTPSTESVAESSKEMGMAQQRLISLNSGILDDYKQQWQSLDKQFEAEMRNMLDELTASEKHNNNQE